MKIVNGVVFRALSVYANDKVVLLMTPIDFSSAIHHFQYQAVKEICPTYSA